MHLCPYMHLLSAICSIDLRLILDAKAASDKITREIEMFGSDFSGFKPEREEPPAESVTETSAAPKAVDKAKKGKVAAKATGLQYQFQIMMTMGIPREEIHKFADPQYWLTYFPPLCMVCSTRFGSLSQINRHTIQADNDAFGSRIDWRRSFITTDANPYYDSFVRWQMNALHKLGKIKFGERYTIYSPKDGQPCMDHDRSEGEALGPQEYTGIRMEVAQFSEAAKQVIESKLGGRRAFFVAATLRPETM